jgi:hypothetical protein
MQGGMAQILISLQAMAKLRRLLLGQKKTGPADDRVHGAGLAVSFLRCHGWINKSLQAIACEDSGYLKAPSFEHPTVAPLEERETAR